MLTAVPGGVQNVNVTINDIPVGSGYVVWLVEAGTTSEYPCMAEGRRTEEQVGWMGGMAGHPAT